MLKQVISFFCLILLVACEKQWQHHSPKPEQPVIFTFNGFWVDESEVNSNEPRSFVLPADSLRQ